MSVIQVLRGRSEEKMIGWGALVRVGEFLEYEARQSADSVMTIQSLLSMNQTRSKASF